MSLNGPAVPSRLLGGGKDFLAEVTKGNVNGHSIMIALGERESMGTTATGEDVWRGNELSPAPTSHTTIPTPAAGGEQMSVVSESANDTNGGTGVRTLNVHYIDSAGAAQVEKVALNGTFAVDLVATDVRFVNDMYALTVGSNGVAAGHIKIYQKADSGLVYNMIALGGNKSLVPHRMVPDGKVLILESWHAEEAQGKRCAFRIRSTDMNGTTLPGVFCFKGVAYLKQGPSGALPLFVLVPSLSIVKVSAWPDQAGAEASTGWMGVLVDGDD